MKCITDIDICTAQDLPGAAAGAPLRPGGSPVMKRVRYMYSPHGYPAGGLKIDAEDPPCVDNFPRESHWLSTSMLVYPRIFNILQVPQETSLV